MGVISLNVENVNEVNDEIEIDLKALFLKVKSLWYILVGGLLVGTLVASMYSIFIATPQYESSSMIYLRGASSSTISLQDLQLGAALTNDYEIILKSRPNLSNVITTLNLKYSPEELSGLITVSNPKDTRILDVKVITDDPNLSKDIANEVVGNGMNSIREIDAQEPYLIEKAIAKEQRVGTSTTKLALMGGLVGLMLAFAGVFVRFIFNDSIQSVEDVERNLGLPVLAVVIEDKSLAYAKKKFVSKHSKNKVRSEKRNG